MHCLSELKSLRSLSIASAGVTVTRARVWLQARPAEGATASPLWNVQLKTQRNAMMLLLLFCDGVRHGKFFNYIAIIKHLVMIKLKDRTLNLTFCRISFLR